MIDVMALRQSYERREIIEVKWIDESNNLVDSMIKTNFKSFSALKQVIDINRIRLDSTEWVKRVNQGENIKHKTESDETKWEKDDELNCTIAFFISKRFECWYQSYVASLITWPTNRWV
jgi:uncharacterized protein (UPF0305 family)